MGVITLFDLLNELAYLSEQLTAALVKLVGIAEKEDHIYPLI